MDDKNFAVEFLDLLASLPENIGASEYQCPIISDDDGNFQIKKVVQELLDNPKYAHLKDWATIERIQSLFS